MCDTPRGSGSIRAVFVWSADLEGGFELYDDRGKSSAAPYYGSSTAMPAVCNTVKYVKSEHNPYRRRTMGLPGAECPCGAPLPMHACNMVMAGIADCECLKLITKAPLTGGSCERAKRV